MILPVRSDRRRAPPRSKSWEEQGDLFILFLKKFFF
jgi:hypothetical protein